MLVAGEASGDILGARLIAALRQRAGDVVEVSGIGGELMIGAGMKSLFPMTDLSVMGIFEVLPKLPRLLGRIRQTAAHAIAERPDAVVTIDTPSFSFRVLRKLAGHGLPRIHYVAPQVWAWRPYRARHMQALVDELLALLPFEPTFFMQYGVSCRFVGHPVVENPWADAAAAAAFRERYDIPAEAPLLALLPGSRMSEIDRHMPIFGETLGLLARLHPGLHALVVTLPAVHDQVRAAARQWPVPASVMAGRDERFAAFAAADLALAASGTVSLELALAGVPTVVAYRTGRLTAALVRRMIRVEHVALPNLLAGRTVLPEFVQENCKPAMIAGALHRLLVDQEARAQQREALAEIGRALGADGEPPSFRAADAVLEVIERAKTGTKGD